MDQTTPFIYPGDEGSKLNQVQDMAKILLEEIGKNQSQENILKIFHRLLKVICEIPRSNAEDIDFALDAAHKAAPA